MKLTHWLIAALLLLTTPALAQQAYDPGGKARVSIYSSGGTGSAIVANPSTVTTVQTSALAASLVVNNAASVLTGFQVSADSTLSGAAWWIMVFNATALPSNGAVTPYKCYAMPNGSTGAGVDFTVPVSLSTGVVVGVSTTGCFSLTASTHAFISASFR